MPVRLSLRAFFLTAAAAAAVATDTSADASVLRTDDVLYKPHTALPVTEADMTRRQSATQDSTWSPEVKFTADGKVDFSAWDEAASGACLSRLRAITLSSNPSGTSLCYNLPMLDVKTGAFVADLRLYRVSGLRGVFKEVSPDEVEMGVAYEAASASLVEGQSDSTNITRRDASLPMLLQSYKLLGQIDKANMTDDMSITNLEALVMPKLRLTAKSASRDQTSADILPNEACFLVGAFSKTVIMSDWAAAQLAVDQQLAALHNGTIPFVLPGTHMMIFPIGLIIVSVWFVVGLSVVGFGTYERFQHRSVYRKAVARGVGNR